MVICGSKKVRKNVRFFGGSPKSMLIKVAPAPEEIKETKESQSEFSTRIRKLYESLELSTLTDLESNYIKFSAEEEWQTVEPTKESGVIEKSPEEAEREKLKNYYQDYEKVLKLCMEDPGSDLWKKEYTSLLSQHKEIDKKTFPKMLYEAANVKYGCFSLLSDPTTKLDVLKLAKAQCDLAVYFYDKNVKFKDREDSNIHLHAVDLQTDLQACFNSFKEPTLTPEPECPQCCIVM